MNSTFKETGEKSLQEVIHLIQGEGSKELVDIALMSGEVLTTTANHPFFVADEKAWEDAGALTLDDVLLNFDGTSTPILDLKAYTEQAKVYNLTVANDHTYFVGVGGVLAHNTGGCEPLNENLWAHIFQGVKKPGRKYLGLHHVEGGRVPDNALIEIKNRFKGGFYEVDVWFKLASGNYRQKHRGTKSTFFPDDWSQDKVKSVINAA